MNTLKLFLLGCMCILTLNSFAQCNTDYQLTWSDEFDGTAVNTNNWVVKQAGGGFGNQEVQYYQAQNATVSDGLLHIKIANETVVDGSTTYNYTSAKLETASKFDFLYGKMEARIKMPDALGSWPAFWMLGSNIGSVGWPHCGEIDIMEWVARAPDAYTGSIFFDGTWPGNHISTAYNIPQGQSFITNYHTFAVEWEPNEIRYYCDGNLYTTYKNSTIAPKEWVFNHNFFLVLNCAIGGSGGGSIINITEPKNMEVDYVRVYSLPETAASITINGPKNLMANKQNVLYKTQYFPNTTYTWTLPNGASIIDGAGTNAIHVNFSNEGGNVEVLASNGCAELSSSITVNLIADECTITYDNFSDVRNVSYNVTGTLVEDFTNPSPNTINSSTLVAQYERNILETYDVLGISNIALETALDYENSTKVFFIDILTSAPIGTAITLQLENGELAAGSYPQGRRSSYTATVSKQNEWHTLRFNFNEIINNATQPNQIDRVSILFDSGNLTGDVYYLDNFRRLKNADGCAPLPTGVTASQLNNKISIYPNPASSVLHITEKNEHQKFFIYNWLGERVMESEGNIINVSQLSSGIYMLKTGLQTLKFVKQ